MNGGVKLINKYDVNINMDSATSHSIILNEIQPNSIVLEFGCANGSTTKYLKNELNCQVYIIEINLDDYNLAIQYAQDGIVCDAVKLEWLEKYKDIQFDYILFADVLEHLSDPEIVLKNSNKLLKFDGKIIISVPNMCNNGVIAELYANKFHYRKTGLLDETHIHFFSYFSLCKMIDNCDNIIEKYNATYTKLKYSEFSIYDSIIPKSVLNYIENKELGDVYQFIFTLVKRDYYQENPSMVIDNKLNYQDIYSSKLYFDNGSGYNEENTKYIENDMLQSAVLISKIPENTQNIRFDPTENSCCKLANLKIYLDNQLVDNFSHNGEKIRNIIIFKTNDPQILIENTQSFNEIKIIYDMEFVDDSAIDIYYNYNNLLQEQSALQNEIFELNRTDFTSKVYIDTGSGFSEDNFVLIENIDSNIQLELQLPENTKGIRFDPFEGKECVVKNIEIYLDNLNFESYTHNGIDISGGVLFNTIDSQINIDNISGNKKLYISCKIVFIDRDFINIYNKNVSILNVDIQLLNQNIDSLNLDITDKKQHIESLSNEVLDKNNHIENLSNEVADKNNHIENLEAEILIKDKEIGLSKVDFQLSEIEINRINTVILEHENNLAELNAQLVATTQEYQLLAQQNHELNQELVNVIASYQEITNAFFWKITKPFRLIIDLLKRIKIINLFIKGIKSLKNDGIGVTLTKVNAKVKKN